MVFQYWPGLTLPDSQYPSLKQRCFDTWTTNRVEQENGNLKEGQTGLKSTSFLSQVMAVTTHRDRKRKDKTLKKSYREEASTPVNPEPILRNLYHLLPTRILVLLEQEGSQRAIPSVLTTPRSDPLKANSCPQNNRGRPLRPGPSKANHPSAARDVMDDSPSSKILKCDCRHFDR